MVEFSVSAILDGFLQLGAFLVTCAGLYFLLKLLTRNQFETHFGRTVITVGAFVFGRVYLSNATWASNAGIALGFTYVLSAVLILGLLKPKPIIGAFVAAVLLGMGMGMEKGTAALAARYLPEGPTFAEYMGVAQAALEENKNQENAASTDLDVVDVMRKGLDAFASLTEKNEIDAMSDDFNRAMSLFAERKAWMDSLTPEEKQAYREEMAAFLAEQGLAEDRYSLAAIRDVNPTNLIVLTTLFDDLQDQETDEEERIRSIPESIAQITANLGGIELTDENRQALQGFAELFGREDVDTAVAKARADLEKVSGDNEFLGTVLAAMIQAESDMPINQMLNENGQENLFDIDSLKAMASNHWKKQGKEPKPEWQVTGQPEAVELVEVVDVEVEPELELKPEPDPFIKVTTHLGVVWVPDNGDEIHEWIVAANSLQIKGYVALGDEVVILRMDGSILSRGECWEVVLKGYRYRFRIDNIMEGRVSMQAESRELIGSNQG